VKQRGSWTNGFVDMGDGKSLDQLMAAIVVRANRDGIGSLNGAQRIAFAASELLATVRTAGLCTYYECSDGYFAGEAVVALESIGARGAAALLARGNCLFPGGHPAAGIGDRREAMWAFSDSTQAELELVEDQLCDQLERAADMLRAYALANADELGA
jgi:hypothetical protein